MSADETTGRGEQDGAAQGAPTQGVGDLPPKAPSVEDEAGVRGGTFCATQPTPTSSAQQNQSIRTTSTDTSFER